MLETPAHDPVPPPPSSMMNCSHACATVRLAMRAPPRFRSADTNRLFAAACSATVPFDCGTMVNCSQVLASWRLEISRSVLGAERPMSAETKLPLIVACSEMVPFALLMIWYCSHVEATDAVAVKNDVPAAVAVTKLLLAIARIVAASLTAQVARATSSHPPA